MTNCSCAASHVNNPLDDQAIDPAEECFMDLAALPIHIRLANRVLEISEKLPPRLTRDIELLNRVSHLIALVGSYNKAITAGRLTAIPADCVTAAMRVDGASLRLAAQRHPPFPLCYAAATPGEPARRHRQRLRPRGAVKESPDV